MTARRAAALASPTGHQQGPPVYLARVGGGRASERAARPRVDRGRARWQRSIRATCAAWRIRASDDQPHEPWGIQCRLFLFLARAHARLSVHRSAHLRRVTRARLAHRVGHGHVHLAARGYGALPATFAALLSPHVVQVTLKNALNSYAEIAESRDYSWPLSALPAGVLTSFDLPDC